MRGVNLQLAQKSTLGVVGENGCGKSITAMSTMRLLKDPPGKIVSGEIVLRRRDGSTVDIVKLDKQGPEMRAIRGAETMVFREPMTSLNPLYTVGDQIAESVQLHKKVSKRGIGTSARDAQPCADQRSGTTCASISPPTKRRHAPTCHDRSLPSPVTHRF